MFASHFLSNNGSYIPTWRISLSGPMTTETTRLLTLRVCSNPSGSVCPSSYGGVQGPLLGGTRDGIGTERRSLTPPQSGGTTEKIGEKKKEQTAKLCEKTQMALSQCFHAFSILQSEQNYKSVYNMHSRLKYNETWNLIQKDVNTLSSLDVTQKI